MGKHVWAGGPGEAGRGVETRREGKAPARSAQGGAPGFLHRGRLGWLRGSSPPAKVQSALGHVVKEGLKWAEGPWRVPSGHFTAAVPWGCLQIHLWGVPCPRRAGPRPVMSRWELAGQPLSSGRPESGQMTRNCRCRPHIVSLGLGTCCSNCRTGRIKT